ncbi:hypothetical protein [Fusobacterium nucleatum]|uniref:hypothetical protein n=1 Tax=Fusobacterium nucleatum TaxID=851 RepID=UPI0030D3C2F7
MGINVNQFYKNIDSPREFVCAHCGARVYVTDIKDKRVKYCSAACEKQYWREKSKQNAAYKKRSREKVLGIRNYSTKDMAIKLYREKKEVEETENIGGKK